MTDVTPLTHTFTAPDGSVHCRCGLAEAAALAAPTTAGLDVERLGFADLLSIGEALLEHYPPDTIVCSHSVKADIGARSAAAIADVIASCRTRLTEPES